MLKCLIRDWWVNIAWGGVERRGVQGDLRSRPARVYVSRHCKWGLARSSPQGPTIRGVCNPDHGPETRGREHHQVALCHG